MARIIIKWTFSMVLCFGDRLGQAIRTYPKQIGPKIIVQVNFYYPMNGCAGIEVSPYGCKSLEEMKIKFTYPSKRYR